MEWNTFFTQCRQGNIMLAHVIFTTFTKDLNPSVQKKIKFLLVPYLAHLTRCPTRCPTHAHTHTHYICSFTSVFMKFSFFALTSESKSLFATFRMRKCIKDKMRGQQTIKDANHFFFYFSSCSIWMEAVGVKPSNFIYLFILHYLFMGGGGIVFHFWGKGQNTFCLFCTHTRKG